MSTNIKTKTKTCSGCGHAVVSDALHCPRCRRKLSSRWPRFAIALILVLLTAGTGWALIPISHAVSATTVSR